jgi:hypothetical protein
MIETRGVRERRHISAACTYRLAQGLEWQSAPPRCPWLLLPAACVVYFGSSGWVRRRVCGGEAGASQEIGKAAVPCLKMCVMCTSVSRWLAR